MADLLRTLGRAMLLDDQAYQAWRERPNLFLRGIVLIVLVSLVAGILSFAVTLWLQIKPVDVASIEESIHQSLEWQLRFNPSFQDPAVRNMAEEMLNAIVPMITDIAAVQAPLPRGISGFLTALSQWLSRAMIAVGGWMFYGALVLIFVNLLGGSAKLPDFLGMVALYAVPGLLGLLQPIPCLGGTLVFIGTVWGIVVYIKATSVIGGLDAGRAILAVVAPIFVLFLLALSLVVLWGLWLGFIF